MLKGRTVASLIAHKSKRSPRVIRSTLAGEAIAKDLGVDKALFFSRFAAAAFAPGPVKGVRPQWPVHTVTDAKALYDALHQLTPSLSEKRTTIDISSIRQEVDIECIHWVLTTEMIADGMTKADDKLMKTITEFLENPVIALVESLTSAELTGGEALM